MALIKIQGKTALIKIQGKMNIQGKTTFNTGYSVSDANAAAYIAAVEAADGSSLEDSVKQAIDQFIVGCKSDGIWSALKASCILAGARTLNGALVPLVGTAPTNFNFVSADYDRKTGLLGNGSTKYLNTNVAGNSASLPQDNIHCSIYASLGPSSTAKGYYIANGFAAGTLAMARSAGSNTAFDVIAQSSSTVFPVYSRQVLTSNAADWFGFKGVRRNNAADLQTRNKSISYSYNKTSAARVSANMVVFRGGPSSAYYGDGRYSFYSLGESLDLALLDTRVTNLMTALNTAI